jgi:hypothetical protein
VEEARQTSALTRRLLKEKASLSDVVSAVERRYPYALNSQKRLTDLFQDLPAPWRRAELEEIAERRASGLWGPTRELLIAYDRILSELVRSNGR